MGRKVNNDITPENMPSRGPMLLDRPFSKQYILNSMAAILKEPQKLTESRFAMRMEIPNDSRFRVSYALVLTQMGMEMNEVYQELFDYQISNIQKINHFYRASQHPLVKGGRVLPRDGAPVPNDLFFALTTSLQEGLLRLQNELMKLSAISR